MYRRGPSKSTPANVQCQKCLRRGHYSYECKAAAQERPYIARPSRTQQLLNPKLVPKLASDTSNALLQDTKGVADQELAKREAERAKKRELEQDDGTDHDSPRRRRSASYDSVSTISTRGPSSPPRQRVSMSPRGPSGAARSPSPIRGSSRRRSFDSVSDYERRYSSSPERRNKGTGSPSRDDSFGHRRLDDEEQPAARQYRDRPRGSYSRSPSRSPPPDNGRRFRSRSPRAHQRRDDSPPQYHDRPAGVNRGKGLEQRGAPRRDARERSLSPFSKRLALTQSMNAGR
ncbi:zinc knuckle-domain-containing protein [Xylaria cubensis]|nr:zinc knuckle-domain-containing protein [Xylaria cubensis]